MENAWRRSDNEFNTCIIAICPALFIPRSHTSTASTLGSHHVFLLFCRLFMTLDPLILLYLLVYGRVRETNVRTKLFGVKMPTIVDSRSAIKILEITLKSRRNPPLPASQIDFRLAKHAGLSYFEAFRWLIVRSIP